MFILVASLSMSGLASCILGILASMFIKVKKKPLCIGLVSSAILFFVAMVISPFSSEATGLDTLSILAGFSAPPIAVIYYLLFSYRKMNPDKEVARIERKTERAKEKQKAKALKFARKITKNVDKGTISAQKQEDKEKERAAIKEYEQTEKKRKRAEQKYRKEVIAYNKQLAKVISKVTIIGSDSKMKTGSAVGRALVGDLIAGPVGSVVGVVSSKKLGLTRFLVEYADGHRVVENVEDNTPRFKELIKYVKI